MARAGRPRKINVARDASGRVSRAGQARDIKAVALAQPHRRGLPKAARADQRAASVAGRLFLGGYLTEEECEAAARLGRARATFMAELARPVRLSDFVEGVRVGAMDSGGPQGVSSVMGRHAASSPSTDDEVRSAIDVPETSEERRERVLRQWSSAEHALWRAVDHKRPAFALALSVCCDERELPHGPAFDEQLAGLKRALGGLVEHWRIGEPARPMRSEKYDRPTWDHDSREVAVIYRERG